MRKKAALIESSDDEYRQELLEQAISNTPFAAIPVILVALVLVVVLWVFVPQYLLIAWFCAVLAISTIRMLLFYGLRRPILSFTTYKTRLRLISGAVLISGFIWSVAGILFFSSDNTQVNVFIVFTLGGLAAASASILAPLQKTLRTYIIIQTSPVIVMLFLAGGHINIAMGSMLIIFAMVCILISVNIFRTHLQSLMLRKENLAEIEDRKKIESELIAIKDELEGIVEKRTIALKLSEERFRNLVEQSSDWIWEMDSTGVLNYSSPKVESLIGYSVDQVIGKPFYYFVFGEDSQRIMEEIGDCIQQGLPFYGVERRLVHKQGNLVVLESNAEPIKDNAGKIMGYRGIDRDITQRKKIEEQFSQNRNLESIGLLAGGIAHDFNNLLSVVFGNISIAKVSASKDSKNYQLMRDAEMAIEQAKKLTGQLLTFAKGGSPVRETVSLKSFIVDTIQFVFSGKAIDSQYSLQDDLWLAKIDKGQIWQVLQNILHNAAEAMSDSGTLVVSADNVQLNKSDFPVLKEGKYVKISVRDNGKGIEKELLARVFEPYFSTKRTNGQRGTGLGLTTCHSIINKHNGYISISSEPGLGTTVTFYLPAEENSNTDEALIAASSPAEQANGSLYILLLDDEDMVVTTICRMLDQLGHTYEVANDGDSAFQLYQDAMERNKKFDLAILDLTIRGGKGGLQTVQKLIEIDPKVKAIVASGYIDSELMSEYRNAGFVDAIAKPFVVSTLKEVIDRNTA